MSFPLSPNDGDLYTSGSGTTYQYSDTRNAWEIVLQAVTGNQGIQGDTGVQGIQGSTGVIGLQGDQGDTGAVGDKGDQGETGAQGPTGAVGAQGDTGVGATGLIGPTGVVGPQGQTGIGWTGAQGPIGAVGPQGTQGETGIGWTGSIGPTGAVGAQGETGSIGADGAMNYWTTVQGEYSSATQIIITDEDNNNKYQNKINRGTILKWSGDKQSMVISSGYTGNNGGYVWANVIGDTPLSGLTGVSYGYEKARLVLFSMAGTLPKAATTNIGGEFYSPFNIKVFGCDVFVSTAGTTGPSIIDINDDGTTMFTTKPSIDVSTTSKRNCSANDGIVVVDSSKVTIDIDANWNAADLYVQLYYTPDKNKDL